MMNIHRFIGAAMLVALAPLAMHAQTPPTPADALSKLQVSVACAMPPEVIFDGPGTLHIMGSQDTVSRESFGETDHLVIDAGTARGIQIGQRFFTRRTVNSTTYTGVRGIVHTSGWVHVIAVNDTRAIAIVDKTCTYVRAGDMLQPFVVPALPADVTVVDRSAEPDFKNMARVMFGDREQETAGAGSHMLIDHGADQGLIPGSRLAIYRDVRRWRGDDPASATGQPLPLSAVGEGVVVLTGPRMAVVRVLRARDRVTRGDYVAPRAAPRP